MENSGLVQFPRRSVYSSANVPPSFEKGFSLLELLIYVTIIAILMTVAVPSMSGVIERNRLETSAVEISNLVSFARVAAVRERTAVKVTPATLSIDGSADWSSGMSVWVDRNGNGAREVTEELKVLKIYDNHSLLSSEDISEVTLTPTGRLKKELEFFLCNPKAGIGKKLVFVPGTTRSFKDLPEGCSDA